MKAGAKNGEAFEDMVEHTLNFWGYIHGEKLAVGRYKRLFMRALDVNPENMGLIPRRRLEAHVDVGQEATDRGGYPSRRSSV